MRLLISMKQPLSTFVFFCIFCPLMLIWILASWFLEFLNMDGFPISHFYRILDTLTDGRVGVNRIQDLVVGGLQFTGRYGFCDHLGYTVSDHMSTQPFAIFGIKDHFNESLGMSGC